MRDWLNDLIRAAGQRRPIPCGGCGRAWDRADMLEASLPHTRVNFGVPDPDRPGRDLEITLSRLDWVGPCCASLANPAEQQP